jgi:hypothetical protein
LFTGAQQQQRQQQQQQQRPQQLTFLPVELPIIYETRKEWSAISDKV